MKEEDKDSKNDKEEEGIKRNRQQVKPIYDEDVKYIEVTDCALAMESKNSLQQIKPTGILSREKQCI